MFFTTSHKFVEKSYSQSGEDLIIKFICYNLIDVPKPVYLDIGAFHPFKYNNFQIFYERGSTGINIEPNEDYFKLFKRYRKKDINLNFGIGPKNGIMKYFIMKNPENNTFSEKEAVKRESQIIDEREVQVITFNSIIEQFCNNKTPDIVSIDVEGFDEEIIKSIDFDKYKPSIFCIETIKFKENATYTKEDSIRDFIIKKGYIHHSDTLINSIFVLKSSLKFLLG